MLKISRLADYALLLLQELVQKAPAYCSANMLAAQTHLALPTVSKVLKRLAEAGILISIRGTQGGYQLAATAENITLAAIISAIDGYPALTECCKPRHRCEQQSICHLSSNWQIINRIFFKILKSLSLADLKRQLNFEDIIISLNPETPFSKLRHHDATE